MRTWTAKSWMQYSSSHVATTALLLSQNGLGSNLRASNFVGEMPPDPPSLACLSDIHVTLLLKILAMGLIIITILLRNTGILMPDFLTF